MEERDPRTGSAGGAQGAPAPGAGSIANHAGDARAQGLALALGDALAASMARYAARDADTTYERELAVMVDRPKAGFSTWYELFPRSCSPDGVRHGTFRDVEARLPYLAAMGFDVVYLPPVHPVGRTHRKGRNNAPTAISGDPGSPWAIGSEEGGHTAVHAELGTLDGFRRLLARAQEFGIEIALDLAYQCSPDHPWVRGHPEWFRRRTDGTVRYAENPPKKYEDIFPLNFETDKWRELWHELRGVVQFWIEQGVRIFRVDNPHTKPFAFWEWLIPDVKREHPDVIFLSEAFTRPKVMYRLAKLGFTQSYTYFAWRNTKWELTEYLTELTRTQVREYLRPNFWPNTPDILTAYLQTGGRPAFMARLVLAATLTANYGIYGPAFELCEHEPREPGSEEYLHSEKYEIRHWDLDQPHSLRDFIARVNRIRRENPALQTDRTLLFHRVDNDQLIVYSKHTESRSKVMLMAVNLDPYHTHAGWVDLDIDALRIGPRETYQVNDLLSGARYLWEGAHNYVELNPQVVPAHVFRIERKVRGEADFEYYSM
ncbi:MAG: alpha-1,4-glucan--maltose-1-phosphate maltosyltransferase [Gemmatimonadetes bacterium]|nr:alpha-1,4-glucan--maltose-1-phosphate maltosyltransferase [Gemmatimonadota bacterium]